LNACRCRRASVALSASDAGSGVASYALVAQDAGGEHPIDSHSPLCDETRSTPQGSSICPFSDSRSFTFDVTQLPERKSTLLARAEDFLREPCFGDPRSSKQGSCTSDHFPLIGLLAKPGG
jgi:hypothetical protein